VRAVGVLVATVWRTLLALALAAADVTALAAAGHAVACLAVGHSRALKAANGAGPSFGSSTVGLDLARRLGLVACGALLLLRGHAAVRDAAQVPTLPTALTLSCRVTTAPLVATDMGGRV
jgi:hypothetical protein